MPASNTKEAIRELVGRRIIGVMFDALPLNDRKLQAGNKTLIFEDGTGFTFNTTGSFWLETSNDIGRAVAVVRSQLEATQQELAGVLELAGDAARRNE